MPDQEVAGEQKLFVSDAGISFPETLNPLHNRAHAWQIVGVGC
jgi:hypothetical protein